MTASATSLRAVDVVVLGAGPAGAGAAVAAHAAGRSVLLIDEAARRRRPDLPQGARLSPAGGGTAPETRTRTSAPAMPCGAS